MVNRQRPFVAQSAEYAELTEILTRPGPGGALILGGLGIGKTTLVRAVLARPEVPAPVMRVHCSPTLAEEPCGALSPYLSAPVQAENPAQVLREISAVLAVDQIPGSIPIVVVEDAEFLDDETAFILSTLVENAAIKLIAIGHSRADGESMLYSLVESGLLSTLVVPPLGQAGVRFLAEEIADGEFTEAAIGVIAAMTGGNPAFVEAFVHSCLDQGLIVRSPQNDGRSLLTLARLAPEPDERLIELVQDVSRSLPPTHRTALEILALAGPQPGAELSSSTCGAHHRIVESGILTTGSDGLVRIRCEIHGITLRSLIPPGRSAQLYRAWTERVAQETEPSPLQILWALEIGANVAAEQVWAAIEKANNSLDYALAWRLAEAEATAESDMSALLRGRTLLGLGRHYSARALFMKAAETSSDPEIVHRALNLLILTIDKMGADVDIDAVERAWTGRVPGCGEVFADDSQRPGTFSELWQIVSGAISGPSSVDEAENLLADQDLSPEGRILSRLSLADLHSVAGRTDTALALARAALAELDGDDRMAADYELLILFRIGWSLVFSGRYAEAEDFLTESRGSTLRIARHRAGALGVIRALLELLRGQTVRAKSTLDEAMTELRLRDMPQTLLLASALRELVDTAASDCGQADRADPAAGAVDGHERRWILARAVAAAAEGEVLERFPLVEREMLASAPGRIFAPDEEGRRAGRRLAELAGEAEGARAVLLGRLAQISVSADPVVAEELARDAVIAGDWGIGARALARAAEVWSEREDIRRCGAVLRELRELLRSRGMTADGYTARALSMAELTGREEEIIDLTRSGKTNAEIARALTVSRRTVEGHLYRIFAKLGVTDRSQLTTSLFDSGTAEQRTG